MPSPFPGMDPYLEHPGLFPGLHQWLIGRLGIELNAVLPSSYVASIGERLYVLQPDRSIYPDVAVVERSSPSPFQQGKEAATSVMQTSDPPWVVTIDPVEMREVFIQIVPVADQSRVITVIEVLSPSNKNARSPGRELYLTKQQEVLASQTNLVEIDLLRHGEHTVAAPREVLLEKGYWNYLVSLHRGGQKVQRFEVWPFLVRQRLPRVLVPLGEGDRDVVVNLQDTFTRCYDEGAFLRRLDYRRDPQPPLSFEDATWADHLLRDRKLR